jgi:hypothetical protein
MSNSIHHCMIDLETLDTEPSAVILSVGAVLFTAEGIYEEREWVLDKDEQIALGRTTSPQTLMWWEKQSAEARMVFTMPKTPLPDFQREFEQWLPFQNKIKVWGNGSTFDNMIVHHMWKHTFKNPQSPWKYYNDACYRTLNMLTGCKDQVVRTGTHHRAVDDARFQALGAIWAFKSLT